MSISKSMFIYLTEKDFFCEKNVFSAEEAVNCDYRKASEIEIVKCSAVQKFINYKCSGNYGIG